MKLAKRTIAGCILLGAMSGCAVEPLDDASSSSDALTRCIEYPLALPADSPEARAEAETELRTLAPNAALSWSAQRGTLTGVTGMDVTVACQDDVGKAVREHLVGHPALYRFRSAEWRTNPFACAALAEATYVRFDRTSFGGVPIAKDVLSVRVEPAKGSIRVSAVFGTYLRPASPLLAASLAGCQKGASADATAIARTTKFEYSRFNRCVPMGEGVYLPQANDQAIPLGTAATWTWDESPDVVLRAERSAELHVAPENWTPELLASDAYCPLQGTLGFAVTVDAWTGHVTGKRSGLGCVVCAR